jgi:endoglucanase
MRQIKFFISVLIVLTTVFSVTSGKVLTAQVQFAGVNLAGAEFGEGNLPGTYNQHYTYPTKAEVDYFTAKGMNVFRLPFRWERLQHETWAVLNATELSRIKNFVSYATLKGAHTILDPHNYARYFGEVIGSANLLPAAFADFWEKLAAEFKDNPNVIFGLMNEPHNMTTESWLEAANAAIAAIRSTGATNLILVPGNGWTGAHSWNSNWYGTPNSVVMKNIADPGNNFAYDVHQYFDSNSSGTSETCVSPTVGADRLQTFTSWLRNNNQRGFLGEFGISANETCMQALDTMLAYMHANADVWMGWTYWAAGPWWGNYMFSIEPANGVDKPQMAILGKYLDNLSTSTGFYPNAGNKSALTGIFPNPFTGSTRIELFLNEPSHVILTIYDVTGNRVIDLLNEKRTAGKHQVLWDGLNEHGQKVPAGIYFCKVKTGYAGKQVIQMIVLPESH